MGITINPAQQSVDPFYVQFTPYILTLILKANEKAILILIPLLPKSYCYAYK